MKHYWPTKEDRWTPGRDGSLEATCERTGCTARRRVLRGGGMQYAERNGARWESRVLPCGGGKRVDKPVELSDDAQWVDFGDVARHRCREQAQYASRYIDGRLGYPNLGVGLRFRSLYPQLDGSRDVDTCNYHCIQIHVDDVDTFVARVLAHKREGRGG